VAPHGKEGESVNRLSFVKLVVDDLEASARFYEQVFGLTRTARFQAPTERGQIDEIVLGSGDGARLIIVKWLEHPAPPPVSW
jgi:predicted enzyme related to lactoylglutathione lyase